MDMLIKFLVKSRRKELATTDFTLSNWYLINNFGTSWLAEEEGKGTTSSQWQAICPTFDVWLQIEDSEIYRVSHLIPTLRWAGGLLGVRLCFEPKDIEVLRKNFLTDYRAAQKVLSQVNSEEENGTKLNIWPRSMRDFLDKPGKLHSYFNIRAYLLDPSLLDLATPDVTPQVLSLEQTPLEIEAFDGLFRIDLIEAQRGFADANADNGSAGATSRGNLSQQLRKYYLKHLDPSEMPDVDDLKALQSLEQAQTTFDSKLKERLENAIKEIEGIGYPGFTDPSISLTSKINPIDSIDHDAAIQFDLFKATLENGVEPLRLPEKLNGLGYKNLISMIFTLIGFRDGWMRLGKAANPVSGDVIEPLHLVLIEEPEAHLHAQVQQVFINKAYEVLRKHPLLGENPDFVTQLIVSTHSSYLAHEVDFANLRYFRRNPASTPNETPTATVVNLTDTFGSKVDETAKFVARYLKTTHCDLFFANGVILVEGAAERMLLPHFIRTYYPKLNTSYISILEINGAHAHRLKPLLERLGLHTLIISDLDSKEKNSAKELEKALPCLKRNQVTDNSTLKLWLPRVTNIDELMSVPDEQKMSGNIRVTYQCSIDLPLSEWSDKETTANAIPYTFEDALALSNANIFKELTSSTGMLKKMVEAISDKNLENARQKLFDALKGEKAKMALDLLFDVDPKILKVPQYIAKGLVWLESELTNVNIDLLSQPPTATIPVGGH